MSFKNQKVSLRLLRQSTQKTVYHMVDKQVNPLLFKNRHKSLNYYQYKKDAYNVQKAYIHTIKEKEEIIEDTPNMLEDAGEVEDLAVEALTNVYSMQLTIWLILFCSTFLVLFYWYLQKKKIINMLWFLLFLTGLCWIKIFRNKKKK